MSHEIWNNNEEIKLFQEYLRIPSVHPNVSYDECIGFLRAQAKSLALPFGIHYPHSETKPVAVMEWTGSEPALPSILLNSHMDVVPVFAEQWTHPPFAAEIDEDGQIFCRGAQDMKCVGMQYLAAIRALKRNGVDRLRRTIYITFVPDEEIGGMEGMVKFVQSEAFHVMNIGLALDEGGPSSDEAFKVFYAERSVWHIHFKFNGTTGHGSLLLKNTAGQKARYLIDRMMDLREAESLKLENNPQMTIGDVTTVNLTMMQGGVQSNVLPPQLTVIFDVRLALDVDHAEFEDKLNRWCEEAGGDVEIIFALKEPKVEATVLDDTNPYWKAVRETFVEEKIEVKTLVCPGRTDSCFLRELGIPVFGFSPMNKTPLLLHDHDERISAAIYLKGIDIYAKIIMKVGNLR